MRLVSPKFVARIVLAILAIAIALGISGEATPSTAHAANATVVHYIINGSWYLHPGNSTDTPSLSGPLSDYMAQGTEFDVQCVTSGPPITPDGNLATDGNGDTAWEYGTDATTGDTGFVSDQGLDTNVTPGNEVAQLEAQGIPLCANNPQPSPTQTTTSISTYFFSGTGIDTGTSNVPRHSDVQYFALNDWAGGNCTLDTVWGDIQNMPSTVNTLAGWSRGRLGPLYFLWVATQAQIAQIHTIILYDPGSTIDFGEPPWYKRLKGIQTCDWQYDPAAIYYGWLQSNPQQNRLIVITGQDSEMKQNPKDPNSSSTYAGLWQYYFSQIWGTPYAEQVTVCDYNDMSHAGTLENYYGLMDTTFSGCPSAPPNTPQQLTTWSP